MNILNKVTLQSLKKNKTRTIVTIIGIILSAAMICAVTTFASSMQNYALQSAIYSDGDWHGSEVNTNYQVYEEISASDKVENAVYMQEIGYAYAQGCTNEYKPYIYVLGSSDGVETMLSIHITAGEYPTTSKEILLPEHLASNGGVKYSIGDTITLALGDRMLDGFIMNQNNPVYIYENGEEVFTGEELQVRETRTYTVVGFYERLQFRIEGYSAPGYTAITIADKAPSDTYRYHIYFKMHNAKDVYDFMEQRGYTGNRNSDVLMYQGTSQYSGFTSMLMGLASIVIALIMFGSISLIYNAFSISVSERTKQFGLLSSVGATKKQLRKMVFFEASVVGIIGIPIGVIAGIAGIGITLMFIGNKFTSMGMPIAMELSVSPISVVIAVIVAMVTVLISAWIPSQRATKVSAVESIRQNSDIKMKHRNVKISKLTYKLFGLPGMLASKHYKRNKKKYRTTVMSLFMSIVLFVSASAFTDYLMESVTGGLGTNGFDLYFMAYDENFNDKTPDDVLELFLSDKNVDKATYTLDQSFDGMVSEGYLNGDNVESVFGGPSSSTGTVTKNTDENCYRAYGSMYFIPDREFKVLLKQNNLDETVFMNPDAPLAIAIDGKVVFDQEKGKYVTVNVLNSDQCEIVCSVLRGYEGYHYYNEEVDDNGNTVVQYINQEDKSDIKVVPYDEACIEYTMKSGKTLYEYPYYILKDSGGTFKLIYPISMYTSVIPEELLDDYGLYRYYMTSDNHGASYENLKQLLAENGFNSSSLTDYAANVEDNRNMVTIIQVFAYGFIVLISLIAAANVFNTISTNISLRRREFAMLKSVGMTANGFNTMMNYECLLYGSRALLYGIPVSCGITYLIYLAITEGYETSFHLPWSAMGISVLSVFAVVFVTMMYSMNKIKKDNPIDALKNENL